MQYKTEYDEEENYEDDGEYYEEEADVEEEEWSIKNSFILITKAVVATLYHLMSYFSLLISYNVVESLFHEYLMKLLLTFALSITAGPQLV